MGVINTFDSLSQVAEFNWKGTMRGSLLGTPLV